MPLQAWKRTGSNPSGEGAWKPAVHFSIGPAKLPQVVQSVWIPPWCMDEEAAIEVFGKEVVDLIGEEPAEINLSMTVLR